MRYRLHPDAALEHEEQVNYYESRSPGLGGRYHQAFRVAVARACEVPQRHKVVIPPAIRRASLRGFPFYLIFRQSGDMVEVLAVAHHRRQPGYWIGRL